MCDYRLCSVVWLDGQGLRRNTIGKLATKKSGEEARVQTSLKGRNMEVRVSRVGAHQRVMIYGEEIGNQAMG